jgi:hypothetical protein
MQRYYLEVGLGVIGVGRIDTWQDEVFFDVVSCDPYKAGKPFDKRSGSIFIPVTWAEGISQ